MSDTHHLEPADLLAHTDWLRELVSRLVSDENLADDVTQSTLQAAMERPPADPGRVRAWLSAVARNFVRREHRSRRRRWRREAQVALPEATSLAVTQERA